MVTKIQFPTLEGESTGDLISLDAPEYQHIKQDIVKIMCKAIDTGLKFDLNMSYSLLLVNLNIGLNIYKNQEETSIIFIYPIPSGYFRLELDNIDYLVSEEDVRDLIKCCNSR